jgi:hypothetical protein
MSDGDVGLEVLLLVLSEHALVRDPEKRGTSFHVGDVVPISLEAGNGDERAGADVAPALEQLKLRDLGVQQEIGKPRRESFGQLAQLL